MRATLLAVLFGAICVSPLVAQNAGGGERFTWTGRVIDDATGQPVEAAAVQIEGARIAALTDSLGRFGIRGVRAGPQRVTVTRIGYVDVALELELTPDESSLLTLTPQPLLLARITATVDGFERRRRSIGHASRAVSRRDLVHSTAPTIGDYVSWHFGFHPTRCPGMRADLCARVRGRVRTVRIFVDEVFIPGGWGYLDHYSPQDLYRVEVYPALAMVRLYTPWYVEKMAAAGIPPRSVLTW